MRAAAGAAAIDVRISVWLVLCVFFLCLYLGFIKRMCDLVSAERAGSAWKPSADYRGMAELEWLLGISAVMTVLMYLSYTLSDHAQSLFGSRAGSTRSSRSRHSRLRRAASTRSTMRSTRRRTDSIR